MSMAPVRKILKPLMDWFSEIQLLRKPLWLVLGNTDDKISGRDLRIIIENVQPGDIIFRRQGRTLSTKVIPGFYSHVGVMKNVNTVIHAVGKGVVEVDLLVFLRTDAACLLRAEDVKLSVKAVHIAEDAVGRPYDYLFDSDDDRALYCTELAMSAYPTLIDPRKRKQDAVSPDDLLHTDGMRILAQSTLKPKEK